MDAPEPAKPVSIKDIARTARVSHSTVSRALRGSPLVSPETTALIRRVAEESGYRPCALARSLVTRRSNTIGVVVTNIADPFVAGVVRGIEEFADERGFSVYLANSNAEPEREMRVVGAFEERRVDGIIVTSSRVGALYVPMLSRMKVPLVLLNNQHPAEFAHSVMIDNERGSYAAADHLVGLGHRRIAYLGDRNGHQSDLERYSGYRRAIEAAGLQYDPELVVHGDGRPEGGCAAMARTLALASPPTAVCCYNDMTALGAISCICAAGLAVPRDISVVGFDDLYLSRYLTPGLTTVRQPMQEMGRKATATLMQLIATGASDHNIRVQGELVIRQSTAPAKAV